MAPSAIRVDGLCVAYGRTAALGGVADKFDDRVNKQAYLDLVNAKYDTDYQMDFLDPAATAVFGIRPTVAIRLREEAFTESPTRWRLDLPWIDGTTRRVTPRARRHR